MRRHNSYPPVTPPPRSRVYPPVQAINIMVQGNSSIPRDRIAGSSIICHPITRAGLPAEFDVGLACPSVGQVCAGSVAATCRGGGLPQLDLRRSALPSPADRVECAEVCPFDVARELFRGSTDSWPTTGARVQNPLPLDQLGILGAWERGPVAPCRTSSPSGSLSWCSGAAVRWGCMCVAALMVRIDRSGRTAAVGNGYS